MEAAAKEHGRGLSSEHAGFQERHCSITLVGSGVSTGIPVIGHLTEDCVCACADALSRPRGPNNRNNVSLLITVKHTGGRDGSAAEGNAKHVLIDCGKTFRDAYFRVLAEHKLRYLDGVLITHDHADAVGGLDDLRDLQRVHTDDDTKTCTIEQYIPTYAAAKTIESMQKQFGYIVRNSWMMGPAPQNAEGHNAALKRVEKEREEAGLTNNIGTRRSAALHIYQLSDTSPSAFYLAAFGEEFKIYALPVEHGKGYMSLGFVFGRGIAFRSRGESDPTNYSCVVYISDVSFVPPEAMAFLHDLVKIDVLIIDLLYGPGKNHPSHYCMDDVLQIVADLKPVRTYGIGMFCEVEHEAGNRLLKEGLEGLRRSGKCGDNVVSVELGYDGMHLSLPLV